MPTRKDPAGRWHVEVCVGRRRLHRRLPAGATARDARRLEAELIRALHAQPGARAPTIPGDPLLAELLGDYTERHAATLRSPDTARYHAWRIGRWIEGRRASNTREVVAAIVRDLSADYAPGTINRSLGALKRALRIAWEHGATQADYSTLVRLLPERNQRTVYLSMEQVKAIADQASQAVRTAIWVALLTGCRRGEICRIRADDIGAASIRIQAGNTKTLRYREVPIVPALRPWLQRLPLSITAEGLKTGFRRAREAAGMPHVHYHDLRHSCATILLHLGAPLHVVREILGHTSVRTTERYAHVMLEPQRAALERLGELHLDLHQTPAARRARKRA